MIDPIKAKIQELCPDVMELKAGCVLGNEDGSIVGVCVDDGHWTCTSDDYQSLDNFDGVEILGSPITLAIVLRAIAKHPDNYCTINEVGELTGFFLNDDNEADEEMVEWNLEHDNYDSQTRETQLFFGSLLGV